MIENILKDVDEKLQNAIDALVKELDSIRAGRATTHSVEDITVNYYGTPTQLKSLSNISISGPRTIQITPYDKSQVKTIEKELMDNPNVDGNASSDGHSIFINLPELTTDKRMDYVKIASTKVEDTKVNCRGIRHNSYKEIDEFKDSVSEDEIKRAKENVDKKLRDVSNKIETLFNEKKTQILG